MEGRDKDGADQARCPSPFGRQATLLVSRTEQSTASADRMKKRFALRRRLENPLRISAGHSARIWRTLPSPVARRTVTNGGALCDRADPHRAGSIAKRYGATIAPELTGDFVIIGETPRRRDAGNCGDLVRLRR